MTRFRGGLEEADFSVGSALEHEQLPLGQGVDPICLHIVHSEDPAACTLFYHVELEVVQHGWDTIGGGEGDGEEGDTGWPLKVVSSVASNLEGFWRQYLGVWCNSP
ncbi:unnamed protein product [Tilletia controversa]|nr:unnamed protein product [Tilletia controversa]